MNRYLVLALLFLLMSGCAGRSPSTSSDQSNSIQPATENPNSLTNAKVETAVAGMLSNYRLGGSVSVKGIQEIPQQNSAVADLQFNDFQYGTTFEGGLLRAKDFKPKKDSGKAIPDPDEMFPQKKVNYSKDGKATLSKYNDGRWVLKGVNWGFDTGVKGNVDIR